MKFCLINNHHMIALGCLSAHGMLIVTNGRKKIESSSRKFIFIGYRYAKKGWMVYDLDIRDVFVSCNVIFHKH